MSETTECNRDDSEDNGYRNNLAENDTPKDRKHLKYDETYTDFNMDAGNIITDEGNVNSDIASNRIGIEGTKNKFLSDETQRSPDDVQQADSITYSSKQRTVANSSFDSSGNVHGTEEFIYATTTSDNNVSAFSAEQEEINRNAKVLFSEPSGREPNSFDQECMDRMSSSHGISCQAPEYDENNYNGKDDSENVSHIDTCEDNEVEAVPCYDKTDDILENTNKLFEDSEKMIERNDKQYHCFNIISAQEEAKVEDVEGSSLGNLQTIDVNHQSTNMVKNETKSEEQLNLSSTIVLCKESADERGSQICTYTTEEKSKISKVNVLTSESSVCRQLSEEKMERTDENPVTKKFDTNGNEKLLDLEEQFDISVIKLNSLDEGHTSSKTELHDLSNQTFKDDEISSSGKDVAGKKYIDIAHMDTFEDSEIESVASLDQKVYTRKEIIEFHDDSEITIEKNDQHFHCLNAFPAKDVEKTKELTENYLENFQTIEAKHHSAEMIENDKKSDDQLNVSSPIEVCNENADERANQICTPTSEEKSKMRRVNVLTSEPSVCCQLSEENMEIPVTEKLLTDGNSKLLDSEEQFDISRIKPNSFDNGHTSSKSILLDASYQTFKDGDHDSTGKDVNGKYCLDKEYTATCEINEIEVFSCHDCTNDTDKDKVIELCEDSENKIAKEDFLDDLHTNKTIKDTAVERTENDTNSKELINISSLVLSNVSNSETNAHNSECTATTNGVSHHTFEHIDVNSIYKNIARNDYCTDVHMNTSKDNKEESVPCSGLTGENENIKENKAIADSGNTIADSDPTPKVEGIEFVGQGKIQKSITKFFPFLNRRREKKISAILPCNSSSEAELSHYTKVQTDLFTNNHQKHVETGSVRGIKKKRSSLASEKFRKQGNIVDFGKKCENCETRPFQDMNDDEIRCLKCFNFECLLCKRQCMCLHTCYCKTIGKTIEDKLAEVKKALREKINSRLPNENAIYTVSTHRYYLHNGKTTLILALNLYKHFETQEGKEFTQSQGNFIEVLILDYEESSSKKYLSSRQAVCVTLRTVVDEKAIGIYDIDKTTRTDKFITPLSKFLDDRNIHAKKVRKFSGKLDEKEAQLIVVCQIHSRAMSDVNAALGGIEEKFYKQIILVLLHFKQMDKRKCASELKSHERYSGMSIIDLFQQPENNNAEDVFMKIIEAINSYE